MSGDADEIAFDLEEDHVDDTLLLPTFEKENLRIKSGSKTFNEFYDETSELRETIAQTANNLLYHWKYISIVFPRSLTGICNGINLANIDRNFEHKNTFANSLFILPSFNELDEVSVDSNGRTKKLDKDQLKSIKKHGEFEVKSIHFPGQTHKWRLARWLQLGYEKSNEYFFQNLATALRLLIITAKDRIISNKFSLVAGAKSMYKGSVRLVDMLIGLPAMNVLPYATELADEERKFLVAELKIDEKEQEKYEKYCEEIRERLKPKSKELNHKFVIPYFFRTPDNLLIDFRLYDHDLMAKALNILKNLIKETENDRKWFSKLRKSLIEKFKSEGLSDADIAEKAKEIINQEYTEIVFQRILNNEEIESLSPRLGYSLVNHARAILIMRECKKKSINELDKHIKEYEKTIKKNYSIRSNISAWLSTCLEKERKAFTERTKYIASEMAIDELKKHDLKQAAYFINRELIFRKNHENFLEYELKKRKAPVKEFTIYRKIWLPKDWIVTKYEPEKCPVVIKPNIFSDSFTPRGSHPLVDEAHYTLSKTYEYKNNTKYPFWRWKNFFLRTWAYFCNSLYIFGIIIPFYSPISFSALFRPKAFYPDWTLDERTGKIHVYEHTKILTFASRIRAIWRHISQARARFELQPDKGLIGKAFQRFLNRIWNYFFKGIIGTASIVIVMPILCLILSTGSIILAILTPVWYPIFSLIVHICYSLIFDWDYPYSSYSIGNRVLVLFQVIIWRFLICGLFQPIAALTTSFLICPLASFFVTLYACLRKLMSSLSDNLMFYLILKPRARVPSHDTFVARRFAGPGLASNHFYQIKIEQALAALEANLEVDILDAYIGYVEKVIGEPESKYCQFFNTLFQPFSCNVTLNSKSTYDYLVREKNGYLEKFRLIASKRRNVLKASISKHDLSQIRLTEIDLNILLIKSTEIVKTQHLKSILPYLKKSEEEFFREHDIDDNDWSLYSGIYLEKIFGTGFLTPLESTDNVFQLEINHLNLSKYSSMIANSELRDDLDTVKTRYNPKGSHFVISMPYLDESIFQTSNSDDYCDKLLKVPSRLPAHPGITSILVYNRDNQNEQIQFYDQKQIDDIIETNRTKNREY